MKLKAAVLKQCGQPLDIVENIEVPVLRPGQVLVKIHYAGICHSQLMEMSGGRGEDRYLPHMLGHEATATVVEVGRDVTTVAPDDTVVLSWIKGTGIEAGGSVYESPMGSINAGAVTTYSDYAVVSENRCYILPKGIGLREGVLFGCAMPTGMGMVQNQLSVLPQHSIGILGLGGIGMSALMAAVECGANTVVAIDTNEDKLTLAKTIGAHVCINPQKVSLLDAVNEITDGRLLDFCIEAAGSCRTIESAFSIVNRNTGKCVFASHPKHGDKIQLDPFELICGKTIQGSWGGGADPQQLLQHASCCSSSSLPLHSLLSDDYNLNNINQAAEDLRQQKVVRAIIKISEKV
ncbi:zinc-binding dehydrogenase [Alteromonas sp. KUL49]|uniref:zinc-binding dehydrogenase n=1 Tax=Alteromonas sp. KUL49 TaxID=2480798 RepID=UPI00102F0191|nr:zinc-binding dehydrogenase [Alteromonas sp. KUL49]TAP39694.1 acetoin dehydrogenase [Alteromonas sp. KUL49]GEA11682.1 dehydrogenase [Alteromonas sp. KUL49]